MSIDVEALLAVIALVGVIIQNYFTARHANKKLAEINSLANGTLKSAHERLDILEAIIERRKLKK